MNKMESAGVGIRAVQPTPYSPSAGFFLEIEMDTKACCKCGIEKPVTEFNKSSNNGDGLACRCKACRAIDTAKYRADHQEEIRVKKRIYRQENKEDIAARQRKYYVDNAEEIKRKRRVYYANNREIISIAARAYDKEHREERNAYGREYYQNHKEDVSNYHKEYALNHPERIKAKDVVAYAILTGRLSRPDYCSACGEECKPHGHHYLGYEKEHWLDVEWLCVSCHKIAHSDLRNEVDSVEA